MADDSLPPPLVPPEVDLRDVPIPRELFAQMAVEHFGIDIETARRWTNDAADRVEGPQRARACRSQKLRRRL